jgi:alpha-mannosidase
MAFGLMPHARSWSEDAIADAADRYRHGFVTVPGTAVPGAWPPEGAGLDAIRLDGPNVVLSSLRRRDGWLEARLVNLSDGPASAMLHGDLTAAREASLRGEPGEALDVADGALPLELRAAEIRTVQLQRPDRAPKPATILDASGPRQNG